MPLGTEPIFVVGAFIGVQLNSPHSFDVHRRVGEHVLHLPYCSRLSLQPLASITHLSGAGRCVRAFRVLDWVTITDQRTPLVFLPRQTRYS